MIQFYLKKSLREHIPINIIYQSDKGITQRKIKVIKINDDKVEAYCYMRKGVRIFKLKNILGADYCKGYIH